jgi:dihydrofolate reductase
VKELSWCSPSDSPNRSDKQGNAKNGAKESNDKVSLDPIDRFGVVAAMARNRIMGVNGKLPWNLVEDRKHFVDLTKGRLLIMGRHTYEEQPSKSHICHAAKNIVVSSTMEPSNHVDVEIARSFPEALHLAKIRATEGDNKDALECWIVGGERIYNEALNHPSAQELHLTIVDMNVDLSKLMNEDPSTTVALFPAKYRWDRHFDEIERTTHETTDENGKPLTYTHVFYKRKVWAKK